MLLFFFAHLGFDPVSSYVPETLHLRIFYATPK